MTPSEIIERANQAERLLADPTLQKAFESVRQGLLVKIENSPVGDRDGHHEMALSLQALKAVVRQLQNWKTDGEIQKVRNE